MKVSTKGTYALRIMTTIALNEDQNLLNVSALSSMTNISDKYLEKIISKLLKAGLLVSFRGVSGGYKLAKEPSEITVNEILNATEGNIKSVGCMNGENCDLFDKCLTVNIWAGLNKVVSDYLKSISLDDIINKRVNH